MEIKLLNAIIDQAKEDIKKSRSEDEIRTFSAIKANAEMLLIRVTQN